MPDEELIPLAEQDRWEAVLDGMPHGFHHTWEHAYAAHLTTGHRTFLYAWRGAGMRIACPLVERDISGHVDIATPAGLTGFVGEGTWSEFAPNWSRFVASRGYVSGYIGIHPLFDRLGVGEHAPQHNSVYVLDLRLGTDELARRMDENRRRQLRGWEARAGDFVADRDTVSAFLASHYGPFMRRVGARTLHFSPRSLEFLCSSERCIVVGTSSSSDLTAASIFGVTPYAGDLVLNIGTGEGRSRATDLLWYGVTALTERGVPQLNLGGGAYEDDSVARAKQRFRPKRLPLRALRQIYRPDAYAELCQTAGVEPEVAEYFPAYRSR